MNKQNKKENKWLSKKYLVISSLTLVVSLIMLVFATVAWFTSDVTGIKSQTVVLDTNGIDLDIALYKGNDIDRDGVLDNVYKNGQLVDTATLSPEDILKKQYTLVDYDGELMTSGCMPGVKVIYKLVIKNKNNFPAKVKTNFAKLDSYFEETYPDVDVTDGVVTGYNGSPDLSELDKLVGKNSARIMFEVNSISANDFTALQYTTAGEKGISRAIDTTVKNLWEISNEQAFVDGVQVNADDTLEINFVLECKQLQNILLGYNNYIDSVYCTGKTADEIKKIKAFASYELSYVTNINITETSAREMYFTIKYLSVRGEQLGR